MEINEREFKKLQDDVKKINGILFGTDNDPRFLTKVRASVVGDEHTSGKPTLINKNRKKYNLETA